MTIAGDLERAKIQASVSNDERTKIGVIASKGHTKMVLKKVLDYAESTDEAEKIRAYIRDILKDETEKEKTVQER